MNRNSESGPTLATNKGVVEPGFDEHFRTKVGGRVGPVWKETWLPAELDSQAAYEEFAQKLELVARASLFGSHCGSPEVEILAADVAALCGDSLYDIVTGAGPSAMDRAGEGLLRSRYQRARSWGFSMEFVDQGFSEYVHMHFPSPNFYMRLKGFMATSTIFICVPGGVGTLLEASMALQLCQKELQEQLQGGTNKFIHNRLVRLTYDELPPDADDRMGFIPKLVLVESQPGDFQHLVAHLEAQVAQGRIEQETTDLVVMAHDLDHLGEILASERESMSTALARVGYKFGD